MANTTNDQAVNAAVDAVAQKFGVSEVDALKILVGKGAENIAKSMGAKAYANGSRIALPGSGGKTTIGHELTHTIQQSARKIKDGK